MSHAEQFTQESELSEKLIGDIARFWQKGVFSSFQGEHQITIAYAAFVLNNSWPNLVIVPGRSEGYLKYKELAYDLSKQQLNLFIIDHRGQGLSDRMMKDRHKGYVEEFSCYVKDLDTFITQVLPSHNQSTEKPLLLAHSMGSAISLGLMQEQPERIKAALLSSPMIAINKGAIPNWLAKVLVNCGTLLNSIFSEQAWYFLGQGKLKFTPFANNQLMHSNVRYQHFTELYQNTPKLQLGGVTFHWLKEALKMEAQIFSLHTKLKTPIQVMQAEADRIVDNLAQYEFCALLHKHNKEQYPDSKPYSIDGAYHELFFEQDSYRNQALTYITQWLAKHR